jgi:hypothetical protein
MNFHIGIAPHVIDTDDFIVAALTFFQKAPGFSLYGMSLPYMRENFNSVVFIRHTSLVKGVNTAVNRSVEKLLIKGLLVPEKTPQVELLVKPSLRGLEFVVPHKVVQKHWILTATQKALELWMQGE